MVSTWACDLLTNHGILAPEDSAIHEERWTPANPHAMSVRRECQSSPPKISDMTQEMRILCTSVATENWSHPVGISTASWNFIFWSLQLLPFSVLTAKPKSWNPSMQLFQPLFYLFAFPCFWRISTSGKWTNELQSLTYGNLWKYSLLAPCGNRIQLWPNVAKATNPQAQEFWPPGHGIRCHLTCVGRC